MWRRTWPRSRTERPGRRETGPSDYARTVGLVTLVGTVVVVFLVNALLCLVRAHVDESPAELRAAAWTGERHICRLSVASRRDMRLPEVIGEEIAGSGLEGHARRSHVLVDGLTLHAATYPNELSAEDFRESLRHELDLLRAAPSEPRPDTAPTR